MKLICIEEDGKVNANLTLSKFVKEMCAANVANYKRMGFKKPWTAFLAIEENKIVGTCAFKAPPANGRVEIAYFTFPEFENQGFATKMATRLVELAQAVDKNIQVFAQTLAEANISTKILSGLKFKKVKEFVHPEDGQVWEWELPKAESAN
jgi:ribosomal-protein-alanine N-acetyltransferase